METIIISCNAKCLFSGSKFKFSIITNGIDKFPLISNNLRTRLDIYTQDALCKDLLVHVISLILTVFKITLSKLHSDVPVSNFYQSKRLIRGVLCVSENFRSKCQRPKSPNDQMWAKLQFGFHNFIQYPSWQLLSMEKTYLDSVKHFRKFEGQK